jgi:hypothetical protein
MAEQIKPDSDGMLHPGNEGWQARKHLVDPELWYVDIAYNQKLLDDLQPGEIERMKPKIELVHRACKAMLAGMIKGTIKYPTDSWTLEEWMAHLVGEGADQMNYNLLLVDCFERARAAHKKMLED